MTTTIAIEIHIILLKLFQNMWLSIRFNKVVFTIIL